MVHTRKLTHVGLSMAMVLALTAGTAAAIGVLPAPNVQHATGVRATAMGGAYTALSSDVSALFYNPAGIGQKSLDLTVSGGALNEDLQNADVVLNPTTTPNDFATMGDGVSSASVMAGLGVGPLAVGGTIDRNFVVNNGAGIATSNTMQDAAFGLGLRVAHAPLTGSEVRLGVAAHALKGETVNYTFDSNSVSTSSQTTGQGFYLNAGAIARITSLVTLGVSATNLGYKYEFDGVAAEPKDPVYTGGVALKVPFLGITLAGDGNTAGTIRYGAETNVIFNLISVRVGQVKAKDADTVTTGGVSLNFGPISAGVAAETVDMVHPDRVVVEGSVRF